MRSLLQTTRTFLSHHEEEASFWQLRFRHPLVVLCSLGAVLGLLAWWYFGTIHTTGQNVYFITTAGLYCTTAVYHGCRPNHLVRFLDQTMIVAYILAIPVALLHEATGTLAIYFTTVGLMAIIKWHKLEQGWQEETLIFFLLGASSCCLVVVWGLPQIAVGHWSVIHGLVWLATVFFIAKLFVYSRGHGRLIPGTWEAPETGHFLLANGVTIFTVIVALYPA